MSKLIFKIFAIYDQNNQIKSIAKNLHFSIIYIEISRKYTKILLKTGKINTYWDSNEKLANLNEIQSVIGYRKKNLNWAFKAKDTNVAITSDMGIKQAIYLLGHLGPIEPHIMINFLVIISIVCLIILLLRNPRWLLEVKIVQTLWPNQYLCSYKCPSKENAPTPPYLEKCYFYYFYCIWVIIALLMNFQPFLVDNLL